MRRGGLGFALTAFVAIRVLGILVLEVAARSEGRSAYGRLTGWDAQWYAGIARHGYGLTKIVPDGRHLSDYAFFPLYPALERGLADLGPLSVLQAGLIISNVSAVAAAWAIYLLGERVAGRGLILVVLWAALPISVVESMAYSEALFTALAAWSLWSVLGGRWVTAGVLTALAGSTRPVGVAVVAAVVVAALLARQRRAWWAVLLAPLGPLAYLGWVGWRRGSWTGYLDVTKAWGNGYDGGVSFLRWVVARPWPEELLLWLAIVMLLGLLLLAVLDRQPPAMLVFAGVLIALALTTAGYFGSKPRYLLPSFPLLLPPALRLPRRAATVVVPLLVGTSAGYGAVWLLGPGPP